MSNTKSRKLLSLVLALVMLMGTFVIPAYAAEGDTEQSNKTDLTKDDFALSLRQYRISSILMQTLLQSALTRNLKLIFLNSLLRVMRVSLSITARKPVMLNVSRITAVRRFALRPERPEGLHLI